VSATILDGAALGKRIRAEVAEDVARLAAHGVRPGLAVVLVGEDPASQVYVRSKHRACIEAGMHSVQITLPTETSEEELLATVDQLNADPQIHGMLVQLPLPKHIDPDKVIHRILPEKDVDGFHPVNIGKLCLGDPTALLPATPSGVQQMLQRHGIATRGKHAVVVGRSNIVGRPMANLLMGGGIAGDATVTVCHRYTTDLGQYTRQADILVVAVGKPDLITADMVKPGAVVVDVGTNRVPDPTTPKGYRLVGDVSYEAVAQLASAITPVPGGVGPMTIAMLLKNTLQAATQAAQTAQTAP
jgi:methylenetetrahydrofolate dehydrogenase (NADP+) / methenyltetrahydrofolate cyclohydrolase